MFFNVKKKFKFLNLELLKSTEDFLSKPLVKAKILSLWIPDSFTILSTEDSLNDKDLKFVENYIMGYMDYNVWWDYIY